MNEDYVSFEIAKLLKEKGFPQEYDIYHSMVYNEEDYEDEYEVQRMVLETKFVKAGTLSSYPVGVPEPKCYCPTLQMAMKWLREKYNIHIEIRYQGNKEYSYKYYINNFKADNKHKFFGTHYMQPINENKTYESACECAIKWCLTKLI